MKARFIALAALVLGLASCQNDFEAGNVVAGGEVDFQLYVDANELATRAGQDGNDTLNGWNSAYGAIDYLKAEADALRYDWTDVDLRYTLEVYDVEEDADGNNVVTNLVPVKDRQVIIKDSYEPVAFNLRLAPNRDYRFVVFADFVEQGASAKPTVTEQANIGLRHTIGATLQDITVKENNVANERLNDEVADAYFAFEDIEITNSNAYLNMVLRRPYGKLRVIATDLAELNLNVEPNEVKVTYTAANPNKFNAVTGDIQVDNTPVEYVIHYNSKAGKTSMADYTYTEGYDAKTVTNDNGDIRHSHITLFTDYILADAEQKPINFNMEVFDRYGDIIKATAFNTAIPVQRNFLTTIIGNVLTTATEVEVTINDYFANVDDDDTTNDHDFTLLETLMNGGTFTLTEDLTITEPTWLKGDAIINLNGHTLNYVASKDGNNHTIMTRVENGSSLRFVGEGAVVSNGYIASANEGGKIYVDGGNYSGETCTLFQANGGEVYISGGVFKAAEYNGDYRYTLNHVDSKKNVGKIEVTGGKFYMYNPAESASENPVMDFVKDGYDVTEAGDWYVVGQVARVSTVEKMVEALNNSDIVVFEAAIDNGSNVTAINGNDVIIDMQDFEVKAGGQGTNNYAFNLNGSDVFVNNANLNGAGFAVLNGSDLTVDSGKIAAHPGKSGRNMFYVVGNSTVTVNEGTYTFDRTSCYFVYVEAGSTCYINGGDWTKPLANNASKDSFVNNASAGTVVITGGTFNVDPTKWLAPGYKATKSGSIWTVTKE